MVKEKCFRVFLYKLVNYSFGESHKVDPVHFATIYKNQFKYNKKTVEYVGELNES